VSGRSVRDVFELADLWPDSDCGCQIALVVEGIAGAANKVRLATTTYTLAVRGKREGQLTRYHGKQRTGSSQLFRFGISLQRVALRQMIGRW
jgi:hypothetical protein